MKYTLIIQSSPCHNPWTGIDFAQQLIQQGHLLSLVFFQFEGVYWGLKLQLPQDEQDPQAAWIQLQQQHKFQMGLCTGSAMRRGVCQPMLMSPFELLSYGTLVAQTAQKVIIFK